MIHDNVMCIYNISCFTVGIEIPDYVASPNKGNLLKAIQNRMVAAGK